MALQQVGKCRNCSFVEGNPETIEEHLITNPDHEITVRIVRVEE